MITLHGTLKGFDSTQVFPVGMRSLLETSGLCPPTMPPPFPTHLRLSSTWTLALPQQGQVSLQQPTVHAMVWSTAHVCLQQRSCSGPRGTE